jgi:hypothetical protein
VGRWLKAYEAQGPKALKLKVRGRREGSGRKLDEDQERRIQKLLIDNTPVQLKMPYALWTRESVRDLIKDQLGIELPIRTVGHYVKRFAGLLRRCSPRQNLLTNRMNPVEDIQDQNGVSRQRMRRSGDTNLTLRSLGDAGELDGSSGEVKGEIFELLGFIVIDKLPTRRSLPPSPRPRRTGGEGGFRMNGKPGRIPFQQFVHEGF